MSLDRNFKALIEQLQPTLNQLLGCSPLEVSKIPATPKLAGVYLFSENEVPIYVGRTRNLRGRIKSHYNMTNPNMGSFAFLMACKTYGRKKAAYKKEGSRKQLHADPDFRKHLEKANKRIKAMTVRFVEINDPVKQHLFELYAAMALGTTEFNQFDTH
ncbi:MAG: GIY-YIG nuclease family protein [Rhodospirillales bacterium]|nr:GIY-YIG nuclease family protein [Rhodospirillales bacterium]MCB9996689.1 GIY-YIG nuclease family protein [Rhodospirillales bacterium]